MSRETKLLREAVFQRANGACECGCQAPLGDSGHLDHFWGRAKAPQSFRNCWALALLCDNAKTVNSPSRAHWLMIFGEHALAHHYFDEYEKVGVALAVLKAKGRG